MMFNYIQKTRNYGDTKEIQRNNNYKFTNYQLKSYLNLNMKPYDNITNHMTRLQEIFLS